jgi:hypothetical protein
MIAPYRASAIVRELWTELCKLPERSPFWDALWRHYRDQGTPRAAFEAMGERRAQGTLAVVASILELAAIWAREPVDLDADAALEALGDDPVFAWLHAHWRERRDEARRGDRPAGLPRAADLSAEARYKVDRVLGSCALLEPVAPVEVFAASAIRSPSLVPLRRDAGPRDDQLRQRIAAVPFMEHGDLMLEQLVRMQLDAAALALAVPIAARVDRGDLTVSLAQRLIQAPPVGALRIEPVVAALVEADEPMLARAVSRMPARDPYDPVEVADRAAAATHLGAPLPPEYVEGLVVACRNAATRLEVLRIVCRATDDPAWAAQVLLQALPLEDTLSTNTHLSLRHAAFADCLVAPLAERATGFRFGAGPL